MKKLFLLLLFVCGPAFGQGLSAVPCLPLMTSSDGQWKGGEYYFGMNADGQWLRWRCWSTTDLRVYNVKLVGLPVIYHLIDGRVKTIRGATDPLRSLQTAHTRFPIENIALDKFATVRAHLEADIYRRGWGYRP